MGSLTSKIADLEEEKKDRKREELRLARVEKLKQTISSTPVNEDMEWLWENKDKIIKNKKLIDLIS